MMPGKIQSVSNMFKLTKILLLKIQSTKSSNYKQKINSNLYFLF